MSHDEFFKSVLLILNEHFACGWEEEALYFRMVKYKKLNNYI